MAIFMHTFLRGAEYNFTNHNFNVTIINKAKSPGAATGIRHRDIIPGRPEAGT